MTLVGWVILALFLAIHVPLAFIYGRSLAGRVHTHARRYNRSAVSVMAPKLVLPIIVALMVIFRFSGADMEEWMEATESRTLRATIPIVWLLGSILGIFFFLSVPFVFGRLFTFAAVLAGWFRDVADEPLRFGASGFRQRAACEKVEDGDA